MSLFVYTMSQKEEWDKIVSSFDSYDVYYLSGYLKGFMIHGDGEPLMFYYEDDNVRGVNTVMKRDIYNDNRFSKVIEKEQYFDLITPYGYGGWLIESKNGVDFSETSTEDSLKLRKPLFDAYEKWCFENRIISEFVRCHPVIKTNLNIEGFYDVVPLGNTISINLSSPETIWSDFTSKNRNMVRKAIKSGVRIYNGNFPEIYKRFRDIYNKTMDKDEADKYYYFSDEFYNSILDDLSSRAQVFWAELNGEIIATSIMICANGYMNYHLSGSLMEYQCFAPTNLLLYKAALWGNSNGYKSLHLGGGVGSKEDSLYKFKSAFNRNETNRFCIGKKIFNEDDYLKLVSLRNMDINGSFFPQYRG